MNQYSNELIDKLRNIYFCRIPLSIVLLSKNMCRGKCHYMSAQLSRAFEKFNYVTGDIADPITMEKINHTWLEVDDKVYDSTDCCVWDKSKYYELYQPIIINKCNEKNCMNSSLYKTGIDLGNLDLGIDIELLLCVLVSSEKDSFFYELLKSEIELFKNKNHYHQDYYKPYVESVARKMFGE